VSPAMQCDRFEREGAIEVERGERLGHHYSICPDCKAAYAQYQRIVSAMSFLDEPEERDSRSDDRLLARLSGGARRGWPKLAPLSAFFGLFTLGRRAAAAPASKALCALTAITTLLCPLPLVMGSAAAPSASRSPIVAIGAPRLPAAVLGVEEGSSHIELRRSADLMRSQHPGARALATSSATSQRAAPTAPEAGGRRCARAKCPNVVLEMVINGLKRYDAGGKERSSAHRK